MLTDIVFSCEDIAAWLNSIGVNAFVLKYRVPGRQWLEFGAGPLMDAQRSMGLVRQMAGEINSVCMQRAAILLIQRFSVALQLLESFRV